MRWYGPCTHSSSFKRKPERERKDVPIIHLLSERGGADTVVRMEEHDEARFCERSPDGLEPRIIEAFPESAGAHDDTLEVWKGCNLLHGGKEEGGIGVCGEGEETEGVESLERLAVVCEHWAFATKGI